MKLIDILCNTMVIIFLSFMKADFPLPRIMDRNLGAMDIYYHGGDGHYGDLYYQFGRKDPFSGERMIYIRQNDGLFRYEKWSLNTYKIANTSANANCNNIPYSINNPLIFITGTYWTYNDIYNPTSYDSTIRWQDPYVKDDAGKSMFDPCPAGWCITHINTWSDFDARAITDDGNRGWYYNPEGTTGKSARIIYYPNTSEEKLGTYYGCWSNCTRNTTESQYLGFLWGRIYKNWHQPRSFGFPVRCVLE